MSLSYPSIQVTAILNIISFQFELELKEAKYNFQTGAWNL
jgi:hypothetical protein